MKRFSRFKAAVLSGASLIAFAATAQAHEFNIPAGDLASALSQFTAETGVDLIVSESAIKGVHTHGLKGEAATDVALTRILSGTGFVQQREDNAIAIVQDTRATTHKLQASDIAPMQLAAASSSGVETIVVTSSKIKGDIQTVPIAITALSQEQLTSRQIAGGPDLVKEVPNLTFTKTNFTGYNIQIRGIGTQAISVTTDPAVAVALNDVPFIRNHFFEQEFFDVSQVEVARGPQGTLFGRNATAGVVNVISAKPTDHYEAMGSVDVGNYNNRRLEGMLNVPLWDDKIDFRVAGEWTKRDGYAYNDISDHQIDGRDLYSTRVSLLVHPVENLTATAVWEHFQENDDRARSTKQLCARSNAPDVVDGPAGPQIPGPLDASNLTGFDGGNFGKPWLSQGCSPVSLYSPQSYQTPNAGGEPFFAPFSVFFSMQGYLSVAKWMDPYTSVTQQHDLRTISSQIDPTYRAKNDTFEFNADYSVAPSLTLTSQTAYSTDFLYSTEDFNRFNTYADFLQDPAQSGAPSYVTAYGTFVGQDNQFCDPQFGCSSRFIAMDRSSETARQFYQELRLSSDLKGPWNFVAGANYMSYHTSEDYYIFSNVLTLIAMQAGNADYGNGTRGTDAPHIPFDAAIANSCDPQPADPANIPNPLFGGLGCQYIDPNPIDKVNGQGHNYFLNHNPYALSSWAAFGEVYYQIEPDVKLTGGLRYTDDKKDFPVYPTWALMAGKGIPQTDDIRQEWQEFTGRAVVDWTPKLDFTDQTMIYASYARGYKGGGANPPGVTPIAAYTPGAYFSSPSNQTHPVTFKPEFNNAFELGTKNTLGDGAVTLNADVFYYKYRNYQISQIIDRTAVNMNVNATVGGAEITSEWSPLPGLKLGFNGGYENTRIDNGQSAIDLMDRTAGNSNWMVVRPFPTQTSNCVLPTYVVNEYLSGQVGAGIPFGCLIAYSLGYDPITFSPYSSSIPGYLGAYPGFDPLAGNSASDPYTGQNTYNGVDYGAAPNNGEGFAKNIGGNQLPNAPHYTASLTADFTMPLSDDWAGTIHGDFYWQSQSWWRVFNDLGYDKLRGYSNVNLAVILTNSDGWQVMGYMKNIFNTTAITGAFLNSDDTSLTTNVFVTDPRLYGIRITKNF